MATTDSPEETPNQRAARLRRERRNAKLQTEGADRLSKITALSGRPAPSDDEPTSSLSTPSRPTPTPSPRPPPSVSAEDPSEVDISSPDQQAALQQALFRQMLRGNSPAPTSDPFAPFGSGPGTPGADGVPDPSEDPMLRMMQQMMGGNGGGQMPNLADLMGGGAAETEQAPSMDYVWRIVHAVASLALGAYAVRVLAYTGTEFSRVRQGADGTQVAPRLFLMFTTLELVLQTARYFVDGGRLPKSGWLGTIGRILPEPYAGYVRIVSRYSIIYTTLVSDVMVVVFVLGAMAWWKGLVGVGVI